MSRHSENPGHGAAAPSRNVALFGAERDPESLRWLEAGNLRFAYHDGGIRYVSLAGHEVLRGAAFIIRDHNWGTYAPEMDEPAVRATSDGLVIELAGRCRHPECDLDLDARIVAVADRELELSVTATMRADFRTNRIGFCVLHPAALSGRPVTVEHVEEGVEESTFPGLIQPWQPFLDIRSLTHEVAPGLRATCRMTGETFEMEDQRQWSDASFKTYCRPLARPFPFVVEAGESVRQAVTLTLDGAAPPAAATADDDAVEVTLRPGESAGRLPELGLGAYPQRLDADTSARDLVAALRPAHLVLEVEPDGAGPDEALRRFAGLVDACGSRAVLDVVLADEAGAEQALATTARAAQAAGVGPEAVLVHPVSAQTLAAARAAFPRARVGGGHNAFFTELNRNRPPEGIGIGRWTTNPTVHAKDDISVAETVEVLPEIVATARSFCHGAPLWSGPNTMRMRFNPNATEKGAGVARLPDGTPETVDARQRGLFGSAWVLASTARWAHGGLEHLSWFEPFGPLGVVYRGEDYPQPWYDDVEEARVYPAYQVLRGLLEAGDPELLAVDTGDSERVVALAQRAGEGVVLWLANLTASPQAVRLSGLPGSASAALLDAERFTSAVTAPDGFWAREARPLDGPGLTLDAYAVARIDC
ncbi:MAG: hypothetical protein U5K43_11940 [Halofilum sp. (in: g-proteobacteria)]|nr:hypothetical protein [Halofilum sp. (in: g-proteobacteria)]